MEPLQLRLDHVVFPTFDVGAAYHFYRHVLGLTLKDALEGDDWGGKPWLMMLFDAGDGRQLVLVGLRGAPKPLTSELPDEIRHIAFAVPSTVERNAWKARLEGAGVKCTEEDHGPQQSVYFADPDGNVLEITAPPSETLRDNPEAEKIVARWLE